MNVRESSGMQMLDKPEKTRALLAALKAALPFEVDLTSEVVATLAAQQAALAVKPRQIVSDVSYAGDEGGIICHILPEEGRDAIFISLTACSDASFPTLRIGRHRLPEASSEEAEEAGRGVNYWRRCCQ